MSRAIVADTPGAPEGIAAAIAFLASGAAGYITGAVLQAGGRARDGMTISVLACAPRKERRPWPPRRPDPYDE